MSPLRRNFVLPSDTQLQPSSGEPKRYHASEEYQHLYNLECVRCDNLFRQVDIPALITGKLLQAAAAHMHIYMLARRKCMHICMIHDCC